MDLLQELGERRKRVALRCELGDSVKCGSQPLRLNRGRICGERSTPASSPHAAAARGARDPVAGYRMQQFERRRRAREVVRDCVQLEHSRVRREPHRSMAATHSPSRFGDRVTRENGLRRLGIIRIIATTSCDGCVIFRIFR